jgi:hypothetical protein
VFSYANIRPHMSSRTPGFDYRNDGCPKQLDQSKRDLTISIYMTYHIWETVASHSAFAVRSLGTLEV